MSLLLRAHPPPTIEPEVPPASVCLLAYVHGIMCVYVYVDVFIFLKDELSSANVAW